MIRNVWSTMAWDDYLDWDSDTDDAGDYGYWDDDTNS